MASCWSNQTNRKNVCTQQYNKGVQSQSRTLQKTGKKLCVLDTKKTYLSLVKRLKAQTGFHNWYHDASVFLSAIAFPSFIPSVIYLLIILHSIPFWNFRTYSPSWNLLYCLLSCFPAAIALTSCRPCALSPVQIYGVFARYPKVPAAPKGAVSGPYPASDLH